jgi:hypothetical protein
VLDIVAEMSSSQSDENAIVAVPSDSEEDLPSKPSLFLSRLFDGIGANSSSSSKLVREAAAFSPKPSRAEIDDFLGG